MDRKCQHCREPWDVYHITHDAFGSWTELRVKLEAMGSDEIIEDEDGGFWKIFYANGLDDVAEGHFMIQQCPTCLPRVGEQGLEECKDCFGSGRVYVKKLFASKHPIYSKWFFGYDPNCRPGPEPFQNLPGYQCSDGFVHQGISYCPTCFKSVDEYNAAMLKAGWNVEECTFIEKEVEVGPVS